VTTPPPSGSNLDHALAYFRLGWWVFPGRSPLDVQVYRQALERKFERQGHADAAKRAADQAERGRKSTFERWRERRAMGPAGRPTEAEIRDWFEFEPLRPVIVLTGDLGDGRQLIGVDVDPSAGGEVDPWTGDAVTLLASTPRGGVHAVHVAAASEALKSSAGKVADGVDIRAEGGLLVAPSGEEATPGRTWLRWGDPSPAPLEEIRARLEARGHGARVVVAAPLDPDEIPAAPPAGGFVRACSEAAPDGSRQKAAGALVGMLARRASLPVDAVFAALELLSESRADLDTETLAELVDGWRDALESSERSLTFTLKVMRAWNTLRARPPWPEDKLEEQTRNRWNTASQREAAARLQPHKTPAVVSENVDEEAEGEVVEDSDEGPRGGVFEPPAEVVDQDEVSDTYIDRRQQISRVTGRALGTLDAEDVARALLPSLRKKYGAAEYKAKLRTPVLSCATLPPWQTITRDGVAPDTSSPYGHGFGPEIDVALAGGLRPGQLILLGAKTAKAGKTAAADQLLDGLLLRSLDVLEKIKRGESTEELVLVRYDFSEMGPGDLTDRQLGRWLGIDSTTFRRGDQAHLAPGIRRRAPDLHLSLEELARLVLAAGEQALEEGRLADLRDLRIMPEIDGLPGKADPQFTADGRPVFKPLDYQSGTLLLRKIIEQIKIHRRLLAAQWGIPEERICPLILVDPIQRYQGDGAGAVEALDGFAKALKEAAIALPCIVVATSDTNKASATGGAKQPDKGKADARNQGEKVAGTLRGSYAGTTHAPDLTLMIEREDEDEDIKPGAPIRVRICTGANRWLARSISIAMWFDPETGRYTPRAEDPAVSSPIVGSADESEDDAPPADPQAQRLAVLRAAHLSPKEAEAVELGTAGLSVEEIAELVLTAEGTPSKVSTVAGYFEKAARKWGVVGHNAAARVPLVVAYARALLEASTGA